MRRRRLVIAFTLALALWACASPPAPRTGPPLGGSAWELVAIQSMDDAQGTTGIAEPGRYTLRLDPGGRASMRLDCNRGTATWEATPASESTGTLTFGPIATTRALCPPPRLDERIARVTRRSSRGYARAERKRGAIRPWTFIEACLVAIGW